MTIQLVHASSLRMKLVLQTLERFGEKEKEGEKERACARARERERARVRERENERARAFGVDQQTNFHDCCAAKGPPNVEDQGIHRLCK
jgi:hypothetical protein